MLKDLAHNDRGAGVWSSSRFGFARRSDDVAGAGASRDRDRVRGPFYEIALERRKRREQEPDSSRALLGWILALGSYKAPRYN